MSLFLQILNCTESHWVPGKSTYSNPTRPTFPSHTITVIVLIVHSSRVCCCIKEVQLGPSSSSSSSSTYIRSPTSTAPTRHPKSCCGEPPAPAYMEQELPEEDSTSYVTAPQQYKSRASISISTSSGRARTFNLYKGKHSAKLSRGLEPDSKAQVFAKLCSQVGPCGHHGWHGTASTSSRASWPAKT